MNGVKNKQNSKSKLPLFLSFGLIGGIIAFYFLVPDVQQFFNETWSILTSDNEKRIEEWVSGFGWFGPFVLVLAMIFQMFLLIIPTILLMVVSVLAYGPIWGSLIILVSVFAASSVGYVIGRYLSQSFIMDLLGEKTEKTIEQSIEEYGFWAVFVTRLNPFLSNDAISFVGGVLKMGYWKFISATLLGILPLTVFVAILGKSTATLKTGLLWGSIISLVAFGGYIWWKKSKSNRA